MIIGMTPKEKLYYLVHQYYLGKYGTEKFADEFTVTFDLEIDYETINKDETDLFGDLCIIIARFILVCQ